MSARGDEPFLARWSRLKREQAEAPEAAPPAVAPAVADDEPVEAAAPLQPVESLTPESDFRPFMDAKVSPDTRRAALKKLFADPQFSVPDPFEAYSGDWTGGDPIPSQMLQTLHQARRVLFDEPPPPPVRDEDAPEPAPEPAEAPASLADAGAPVASVAADEPAPVAVVVDKEAHGRT